MGICSVKAGKEIIIGIFKCENVLFSSMFSNIGENMWVGWTLMLTFAFQMTPM